MTCYYWCSRNAAQEAGTAEERKAQAEVAAAIDHYRDVCKHVSRNCFDKSPAAYVVMTSHCNDAEAEGAPDGIGGQHIPEAVLQQVFCPGLVCIRPRRRRRGNVNIRK